MLVVKVAAESESQKAGLQENDVIRGVNGQIVRGLKEFATAWKEQIRLGDATLKVWRYQAELSVVIPAP